MRKPKLTASSFERLSDAEKEAIYQDCENLTWDQAHPLTARERREWEAIKRGPGRPRKGKGAAVISLSVERGLLNLADAFAKAHGLTRSEFITRGIKAALAAGGAA